jgi:UDP-N-acetylglucosamine--N-acetylmuramyl-(pentapeptide) pyrophosphoryl-undecaprenol N-acetylglucosamine transferase
MNRSQKYIISGGGTGGHIFPALSIANEIRKRNTNASVLFVGATGKMEMEKVPEAGYPIIGLPIEGLQRKIGFRNIVVMVKLIISLIKATRIIKSYKPDVVIGVGGYASGPLLRIAALQHIPTLIQEQNSYAGITNRWLAGKANKICVAYHGMEKYFPAGKVILTGNPIREEIVSGKANKSESLGFFGLTDKMPVLLILGGSLGARTINESILGEIDWLEKQNIQVIWQTGRLYIERIKYELNGKEIKNIRYFDFIKRMDLAYSVADIIISRAGATTISELCMLGKPVILVPSPNVAEDHQTKNANALVKNNAAIMVTDKEAREKLVKQVIGLVNNQALREELALNCRKMALPDSASRIVDEIEKLIRTK